MNSKKTDSKKESTPSDTEEEFFEYDSIYTFYFFEWITKKLALADFQKKIKAIDDHFPNVVYGVDIDLLNKLTRINNLPALSESQVDAMVAQIPLDELQEEEIEN